VMARRLKGLYAQLLSAPFSARARA
jgi:hypothetical protein